MNISTPALLPVGHLHPSPHQPRVVFDEDELAQLASSIRLDGVLSPLLVRPDASGYEIVAGERRWRAAVLAGLSEVPAMIREDLTETDVSRIALVENTQRSNLNAIEEAQAVRNLKESTGLSDDEVAQMLSKSRSYVTGILGMLRLPESVQRRIASGVLTPGHGKVLSRVPNSEYCETLADRVVSEGLSVRDLEEVLILGSPEQRKRRRASATVGTELENVAATHLSDLLNTRVRVLPGRARGRVLIEYAGEEDLLRLLNVLGVDLGRSDI